MNDICFLNTQTHIVRWIKCAYTKRKLACAKMTCVKNDYCCECSWFAQNTVMKIPTEASCNRSTYGEHIINYIPHHLTANKKETQFLFRLYHTAIYATFFIWKNGKYFRIFTRLAIRENFIIVIKRFHYAYVCTPKSAFILFKYPSQYPLNRFLSLSLSLFFNF